MRERTSSALVVVVCVVLVGLSVAGAAGGATASSRAQSNATEYDLAELRRGGQQVAGAAPSERWLTKYESVWVDYPHTNPVLAQQGSEWEAEQILKPGRTVPTNTLRFHASGPKGAGARNITVKVVYWQVGTKTVEGPNGSTTTERYLTNVTTETHQLTFSGARGEAELSLRAHYEQPVEVTMWIVGHRDTARWRFTHHSLKTTQQVTTTTAGERLWWLIQDYVLWVVFGGFIMVAGIYGAKRRAGAGPMKGMAWWSIVLVLVGGGTLLFAYESLAELFIDGPRVLAFLTLALIGIPILEHERELRKWLFVRPVLTSARNAAGEDALDAIQFELDGRKVVRMPNGRLAVVEPGILKFFARLFGGAAYLEGQEGIETETEAIGETSYDALALSKASAESALDYEAEGWAFNMPTSGTGLITLGVLSIALAWVGDALLGSTAVGVVALPMLAIRPEAGHARIDPAAAQTRAAFVTMLWGTKQIDEAETLKEAREQVVAERARNQKDVEAALEQQDATLVTEAVTGLDTDLFAEPDGATNGTANAASAPAGDDGDSDGGSGGGLLLNLAEQTGVLDSDDE